MIETEKGVFVNELKNRFLCSVKVNETLEECYVPNSSKLQNYIDLEGRSVLLTKNKAQKSRTQYSLFAVEYNKNYILLNLNMLNKIVEELIMNNYFYNNSDFLIQREKKVSKNYKTDLYLVDRLKKNEIIMEIKGIISIENKTVFPGVKSQRSIEQLKEIKALLLEGKKIHYLLISLSPTVKEIHLKGNQDYIRLLKECMSYGLILKGIRLIYDGVKISHDELIKLVF